MGNSCSTVFNYRRINKTENQKITKEKYFPIELETKYISKIINNDDNDFDIEDVKKLIINNNFGCIVIDPKYDFFVKLLFDEKYEILIKNNFSSLFLMYTNKSIDYLYKYGSDEQQMIIYESTIGINFFISTSNIEGLKKCKNEKSLYWGFEMAFEKNPQILLSNETSIKWLLDNKKTIDVNKVLREKTHPYLFSLNGIRLFVKYNVRGEKCWNLINNNYDAIMCIIIHDMINYKYIKNLIESISNQTIISRIISTICLCDHVLYDEIISTTFGLNKRILHDNNNQTIDTYYWFMYNNEKYLNSTILMSQIYDENFTCQNNCCVYKYCDCFTHKNFRRSMREILGQNKFIDFKYYELQKTENDDAHAILTILNKYKIYSISEIINANTEQLDKFHNIMKKIKCDKFMLMDNSIFVLRKNKEVLNNEYNYSININIRDEHTFYNNKWYTHSDQNSRILNCKYIIPLFLINPLTLTEITKYEKGCQFLISWDIKKYESILLKSNLGLMTLSKTKIGYEILQKTLEGKRELMKSQSGIEFLCTTEEGRKFYMEHKTKP